MAAQESSEGPGGPAGWLRSAAVYGGPGDLLRALLQSAEVASTEQIGAALSKIESATTQAAEADALEGLRLVIGHTEYGIRYSLKVEHRENDGGRALHRTSLTMNGRDTIVATRTVSYTTNLDGDDYECAHRDTTYLLDRDDTSTRTYAVIAELAATEA